MLKRMNLVRWFMLANALSWVYLWGQVVWHLIPFNPLFLRHGRVYIWMIFGHHAISATALDYDFLTQVVVALQAGSLLPLMLVRNVISNHVPSLWNGLFLGVDINGWFLIAATVLSFAFWFGVARLTKRIRRFRH